MKKILITGVNSFIGNSLYKWLNQYPDKYVVETISLRTGAWRQQSFANYDVVFHVAGIAHVPTKSSMNSLYFKVNRDLTIEVAQKAKAEGVKQFIFMSSIIIYGEAKNSNGAINKNTVPKPTNCYGISKLEAEERILQLENQEFKVAIIRPPMIYGKGSKGNYPKLAKAAKVLPIFPSVQNIRSMLHIDNLCEFIKAIIDYEDKGIYFPQNMEYISTSELVRTIACVHERDIKLTTMFNWLITPLIPKSSFIAKVFGNLYYDKSMSEYRYNYRIRNLRNSIERTEK